MWNFVLCRSHLGPECLKNLFPTPIVPPLPASPPPPAHRLKVAGDLTFSLVKLGHTVVCDTLLLLSYGLYNKKAGTWQNWLKGEKYLLLILIKSVHLIGLYRKITLKKNYKNVT